MRYVFFTCCLLLFETLSAQVSFSSIPFAEALRNAQAQGKLIFLQFEAVDCEQCNDVANKGLSDKAVADRINQTFFCLKIDAHHPDRNRIAEQYNVNSDKGFGTLFIDNNGTLVHKFLSTTSRSSEYLNQTDIALAKAGESLKINELEKEYKSGNRSYGFLETLLLKRRALNFPTDSLLDEYVDALPPDSLNTVNTICFIAQMTPYIDSKPFKVMTADRNFFDRAWYTMPNQSRVQINYAMEFRSMSKAIQEHNLAYASRIASFAQSTNGGNYIAGAKAFDQNMLRYYDETNDTTTYFRKAIAFYERYYLSVNADSIRKIDSTNISNMMHSASIKKDTIREGNKVRVTGSAPFRPAGQYFAGQLIDGAYKFYQRTSNPYLLSIATEWCERALQFYKSPESLDTYAKLLYKQRKDEKAIEVLNEAIALQQKRGYPTKLYESELDAIRNKKPLSN
ncbi:MAG: thioredoxin family protein [Flavisolibacter sp.]